MPDQIVFKFQDRLYAVDFKAYNLNRIVLPDGRLLEADEWRESYPPQPQNLHEVNHTFQGFDPEEIAKLLNGVVAEDVITP